jgi:5-methylcytosine-specific restriction endonuclease McrA
MRPVTVPLPAPNYDDASQEAVQVNGNKPTSKQPPAKKAKLVWTKMDIAGVIQKLLDSWINSGAPIENGGPRFVTVAERDDFTANLERLGSGASWGAARKDLIGAIGAYCSYCNSPVYSHLAIEHKLPKSTFPQQAFKYANFLLACSTCNSAKGNNPNHGTAVGNPLTKLNAINVINNTNGLVYYWPDYAWPQPTDPPSIFPFRYRLAWMDAQRNKLDFTEPMVEMDVKGFLHDFKYGAFVIDRGLYYMPFKMKGKNYYGLEMIPAPGISPTQTQAAQNIIELASLNRIIPVTKVSDTIDRRIESRTTAYFTAMLMKEQLDRAANSAPRLLAPLLEQARQTIARTGHWLIWRQIFARAIYGNVSAEQMIQACFPGTADVQWIF